MKGIGQPPVNYFSCSIKPWMLVAALLVVFLILISTEPVSAQCAMCRASVETNANNGNTRTAAGLNKGILYLMAMPYMIFAFLGYMWYSKSRKNKLVQDELRERKISNSRGRES